MAEDRDDPAGRAEWFRKRRAGPDAAPGLILKASQARLLQLLEQAVAFRPPGGAGSVNWTPIGPSAVRHGAPAGAPTVSGRITGIAAGPGGRVYAGAADGGAWFSGNSGKSWEPLDEWFWRAPLPPADHLANSLSVGAIAVRFGAQRANDLVFVGTGYPPGSTHKYFGVGIKFSSDGGQTFSLEATNLAGQGVFALAINPVTSDPVVYAATTAGLYQRPVLGGDWTTVNTSHAATDVIVVADGMATVCYAAYQTADPNKIFASSNGGPWQPVGGIPAAIEGRIALAASEENVLTGVRPVIYALSYDRNDVPVLFRSDGGSDFQAVAFRPGLAGAPDLNDLFGPDGFYHMAIGVDPADPNLVYLAGAGTTDPITRTYDMMLFGCQVDTTGSSGPTLTPTYIGRGIHSDAHDLAFECKSDGTHKSDIIWVATDGGPFRSTQTGAPGSFEPRNNGLAITQLTYLDHRPDTDAVVLSGCEDNGTVRYWGEPAWFHSAPGDGGGVAFDPNDPRRIMRQGTKADLMVCVDGALNEASWRDLWDDDLFPPTPNKTMKAKENHNTAFFTRIRAFNAGGGRTAVAFGTNRLWVTLDWGTTWTTLPSNTNPLATPPGDFDQDKLDGEIADIRFAPPTRIYVTTSPNDDHSAAIYKFEQSGGTWSKTQMSSPTGLPSGVPFSSVAVESAAAGTIYLGLGGAGAYDRVWYFDGSAWTGTRSSSAGAIPDVPVNALVVDPANTNVVFVGTDVGVWKGTKVAGNSWIWEIFSSGLPESAVLDLEIHPKARLLRAATHGRGAWEFNLDLTSGRDTDVYLRAHNADSGRRFSWAANVPDPAASTGYATTAASPDIRVCRSSKPAPTAPLDFVGFADLDINGRTLDPTGTNKIFVQVHNRGPVTASANDVSVLLLLAAADSGVPPFPADFTARIASKDTSNWLGATGWKFANPAAPYQTVPTDLTARVSQVVGFDVDLSTWPLTKGSVCAAAFVTATNDPISGRYPSLAAALAANKYLAIRMLRVASPSSYWRGADTGVGSAYRGRWSHSTTSLRSGDVLLTNGIRRNPGGKHFQSPTVPAPDADLYNPTTNAWAPLLPATDFLSTVATTLLDGKVLITRLVSKKVDLYDPATGALSPAADRSVDFNGASSAVLLKGGQVLLLAPNGAEMFTPRTNRWTVMPAPTGVVTLLTATLLTDGRVLIQGLGDRSLGFPMVAQLFDADTPQWTAAPPNNVLSNVAFTTATRLPNDKVLFAGGYTASGYDPIAAGAAIFDPAATTNAWTLAKPMNQPRDGHTATLLDDGTVLVVGGISDDSDDDLVVATESAELYDFRSDSWQPAPSLAVPHCYHSATKLATGEVLIAGGYRFKERVQGRVAYGGSGREIYAPSVP